jgi:hypothetical protein
MHMAETSLTGFSIIMNLIDQFGELGRPQAQARPEIKIALGGVTAPRVLGA